MTDPDSSTSSNTAPIDIDSPVAIRARSKPPQTAHISTPERKSPTDSNGLGDDASDLRFRCSQKTDTATVNNQDYAIKDSNRKEITRGVLSLDHASFATKWKAVHRGPNARVSVAPEVARQKGGRCGIE